MYELDDSFNLVFKDNSGHKITIGKKIINELKYEELTSFPEGTTIFDDIIETQFYKLSFPDESILKIFMSPVQCKFISYNKTIDLYSYEHLELILQILKYNCPFYFSKFYHKKVYIDINKIEETNFNVDKHIEIIEKVDDYTKINNIYNELQKKYINEKRNYTYKFINPNYNNYFFIQNKNEQNLSEKFKYIKSDTRNDILNKIEYFVKNSNLNDISSQVNEEGLVLKENDPFLLPVCGPHGTGKTITALYIHKYLFLKGIKGVYLNLKYYSKDNISLEDKIDVLIKECFFIVDNQNELLELYKQFIRLNDFYPAIFLIKDFIEQKKKKKNKNIYMIFDQYQEKYNFRDFLKIIKEIKIFLLSSINDKDVKMNLINKFKEEICINSKMELQDENPNPNPNPRNIIRYNYIENLIDPELFKHDSYKNIFINKIKQNETDEIKINNELSFVYYILEKFNFIPKYVFGYINYYGSILDLLFEEYVNIIKKLNLFTDLGTININELIKLDNGNFLAKKNDINNTNTFTKDKFVEILNYIPLKYISYSQKENGEYYFYCSFPLFKKILKDFINYIEAKSSFFISDNGGERGTSFEKIIKMKFRGFKKLKIDGYLKVDKLINMVLTKKYKNINKRYFTFKNNIFIDQKIDQGKDYDFGIYQPKKGYLILIQSKYIINNGTVKNDISYYKKSANIALNSFKNNINENVNKVYILYMSSVEYNYENREKVMGTTLANNFINCLFYSVNYDNFSMDFGNFINEIECKDSFMIIPYYIYYEPQKPLNNSLFQAQIQLKEKKSEKDIILLQKKNLKVIDLKELHNQIIKFIHNSNFNKIDIIKSLGPFKSINNYFVMNKSEINKFEIKKKTEYILIIFLDKFGIFDTGKDLGLIYFEDGNNIFYNFAENKYYYDYNELINSFPPYFLYVIGTKSKKK